MSCAIPPHSHVPGGHHASPVSSDAGYDLMFEGTAQFISNGIPANLFGNFGKGGDWKPFLYAWADSTRGSGTQIEYTSGTSSGSFKFTVRVHPGDPDLLKVQYLVRSTDEESGNRRTVNVGMSALDLSKLAMGQQQTQSVKDAFNQQNEVVFKMKLCSPVPQSLALSPSKLWNIEQVDKAILAMSGSVKSALTQNSVEVDPRIKPFTGGITSWEFSGGKFDDGREIPQFLTHYALMGAQEESLNRTIPIPVLLYNIYMGVAHSGGTVKSVLQLPAKEKAEFFAGCMSMTQCAGTVNYERDFVPEISISPFMPIPTLTKRSTENMAMPCSAAHFLGMRLSSSAKPVNPRDAEKYAGKSMEELQGLLKGGSELMLSLECDDCESLTFFTQMLKRTWATASTDPTQLQRDCAGFDVFQNWTPECWTQMSALLAEGRTMLNSGELSIVNCVGMASDASAAGNVDSSTGFAGHCYALGIHTHELTSAPHCFMVEGTAMLRQIMVKDDTPKIAAMTKTGGSDEWKLEKMDVASAMSILSKGILMGTQIINMPSGHAPDATQGGWKLPGVKAAGWMGHQMTMSTLDSDRSYPLKFYRQVLFTGLTGDTDCIGSLAVDGSTSLYAGCYPRGFTEPNVQGIGIKADSAILQMSREIMNEACPPLADRTTFQQIMNRWVLCEKFSELNQDLEAEIKEESYITWLMECPASPEYLPIMYAAKKKLFAQVNEINLKRQDSDGIFSVVRCMGTGVHVGLLIPKDKEIQLSVLKSLKEASEKTRWPSLFKIGA